MTKKITFSLLLCAFSFNIALSQVIQFNFNDPPYTVSTSQNVQLTVSDWFVSQGSLKTNQSTGTYFNNEPYIASSGSWASQTIETAKYFYFNALADANYQYTLNKLHLNVYATNAGPSALSIVINNDSIYTVNLKASTLTTINIPITGFDNIFTSTIKIMGWDNGSRSTSGAGDLRIDDIELALSISPLAPKDTNSRLVQDSYKAPQFISSLHPIADSIKVLAFEIIDSASGDLSSTIIDSLIFIQPNDTNHYGLNEYISKVVLYQSLTKQCYFGKISDTSLLITPLQQINIAEGEGNKQGFELYLWLNKDAKINDHKNIQLQLNAANIFCNPKGSKINQGSINTKPDRLKTEVVASQIKAKVDAIVWQDSAFSVELKACDQNGNVDKDFNKNIHISLQSDHEKFNNETQKTHFNQGFFKQANLYFNDADTTLLTITSDSLLPYTDTILCAKLLFKARFENNDLLQWKNTQDWNIKEQALEHHLTDTNATSYIASQYKQPIFNTGKTIWEISLRNGDFDLTSSNRFWYYLMASDEQLLHDSIYGYALGVNFSGSNDSLSLWRVDANKNKHLLIQSQLNWNSNTHCNIKVSRSNLGYWQLAFDTTQTQNAYNPSNRVFDATYNNLNYHGLVFQYSATRAGLLSMNKMQAYQINQAPALLKVSTQNENTLLLTFSEALDSTTIFDRASYSILKNNEESIEIKNIQFDNLKNTVALTVPTLKSATYYIKAQALTDLNGYTIKEQGIAINYQQPAQWGDLVINEIMYDATPTVGLPSYDYIELYNRSELSFNLNNWKISIGNYTRTLTDTLINPREHLIVTSLNGVDSLKKYGKTLCGMGESYLTNTGKTIELKNDKAQTIDSIRYNQTWLNNFLKEDGGWSLERIDYNNLCGTSSNWSASVNSKGGTPGKTNSIYRHNRDSILPYVTDITIQTAKNLVINFNEAVAFSPYSFEITNGSNKITIDTSFFSPTLKTSISLHLHDSLFSETNYPVKISQLNDECANSLIDTTITISYYEAKKHDVVFTEIMYDANSDSEFYAADYLELYNRSAHKINLTNWTLEYDSNTKPLPNLELAPQEHLIICAKSDTNLFSHKAKTAGIISSTTLTLQGKAIELYNKQHLLIDAVAYNPTWHTYPEKENSGISLEKINPDNVCSISDNWTSCVNEKGGSAGTKNSVNALLYDNTKPEVIYHKTINASTIEVAFTEAIDTTLLHDFNHFMFAQQNIVIDHISTNNNPQSIHIVLKNILRFGWHYQFSIKQLSDLCGNYLNDTLLTFEYVNNEANDIVINEVYADPNPSNGLANFEYLELYNRSDKTFLLENWQLIINNNALSLPAYKLKPNDYLICCSAIDGEYSNYIQWANFPALPNDSAHIQLLDTSQFEVCHFTYLNNYHNAEKSGGGWSLERIDANNLCSQGNNWHSSIDRSGGTPGYKNSIAQTNLDLQAISIQKLYTVSDKKIVLALTENPCATSLLKSNQFILDSAFYPSAISTSPFQIVLLFDAPFQNDSNHVLLIKNLTDECNNITNDTLLQFNYHNPQYADVVINEIMANPKNWYGLPHAEYIEIYNRSNFTIPLYQWNIEINGSKCQLNNALLKSNEYAIICDENEALLFAEYGQVIGVKNMRTLANDGEISLINANATAINTTKYTSQWLSNDIAIDGAYSLERIDYNNNENSTNNWQACINEQGGTPGTKNSVFANNPDQNAPFIVSCFPNNKSINLTFSETIQNQKLLPEHFVINSDKHHIISTQWSNNEQSALTLVINHLLDANTKYQLDIVGDLVDLNNNKLSYNSCQFMLPEQVNHQDIVINEVLFNPTELGCDFVEIYNNSTHAIDLSKIKISNYDNYGQINSPVYITPLPQLIMPGNFIVITESISKLKNQFITINEANIMALKQLPTFPDKEGSVVLLDSTNQIIDEFNYDETMHFSLITDREGVSLERINYTLPSNDKANWHSASQNVQWGTPTQQNSVFNEKPESNSEIKIEPEAFSPDNDGFEDLTQIYYQFEKAGYMANAFIINKAGYNIKTIANNELLGSEGQWQWDGTTNTGQKAPIGIYIVFIDVYDLEGNQKKFKKVCVVSTPFN